jgi:transcriptional regulator
VHGENAYVTPSWYATKKEHGRVVPTWDYTTAHVYGELQIHDDPVWVDALVRRLTERHESRRAKPWSVDDMPEPFHKAQLRAIVGLELMVSRIEVKYKLSQNRSEADIDGVIDGLTNDGLSHVAEVARRARPSA